tara:strand:+ start:5078 stop:5545 length:468 start_codon:yes stop_codon:yes gene_type:complete
MKRESLFGGSFHWFAGEVKEIGDHNRVKVRAFGYHSDGVTKDDLPWATVMMPTTVAGTADSSANHHLEEGSWVIGFFTDGSSAQDPVIIGSITGEDYAGGTAKKKVYKSQGGHTIIMDNEPGDIKVSHKSGSTITMDKDGDVVIASAVGKKTKII